MGTAATWQTATTNGYPGSVQVAEFVMTVPTGAVVDSAYTLEDLVGEVVKVEIDPGTLTASATIKIYEYGTDLATGTRDHFVDYTVPNPAVEVVFYPMFESSSTNANGALTTKSSQRRVSVGPMQCDLAAANAADSVTIRVYVKS